MSVPTVTLEEATKTVGTAPSLAPRPSGTNIRTLTKYFVKKIASIPSNQSRDHGYSGMIKQKEVYALKCNIPWRDAGDPGPHRKVDPQLNTAGQNDATVEYIFSKGVFKNNIICSFPSPISLSISQPLSPAVSPSASVSITMYIAL